MSLIASNRKRFGPFEVDLRTHELWKHGIRIKIVGQPIAILEVLLSRPGDLITRDELRARLWPADTFIDFNHGLNAAMNKLREALSDSADNPKYIETLPRRGYRFIAQVEAAAPPPAEEPVSQVEPPLPPQFASMVSETEPSPITEESAHPFSRLRPMLGVPILAVGVLTIIGAIVLHREIAQPSLPTIGVVPTRTRALTQTPDDISDPTFSPDGSQVAFRRRSTTPTGAGIFVKEVDRDRLLQLTKNPGDCCPVFSPDGHSVAFSRFADKQQAVFLIPSSGGEERRLYYGVKRKEHGELDWSPDGKSIVFGAASPQGTYSLRILSLESLQARELSTPSPQEDDWGPAFSPDGQYLAFVRNRAGDRSEDLMLMRLPGSEVQVITSEPAGILGTPAWSVDGNSVIYSSYRGGDRRLLKIGISEKQANPVQTVTHPAWHPALSRRGFRLAYVRSLTTSAIRLLDLSQVTHEASTTTLLSSSDRNDGPQFSPDGKRLAFMSDRSGTLEIWISDRDGSNPFQITAIGNAGSPKWSPDGKRIAFDSVQNGRAQVFTVNVDHGEVTPLTNNDSENMAPSWSQDGAFVYFASDRTGSFQVWKVPSRGGTPIRITNSGGFAAAESLDGHFVYFAKSRFPNPEIWWIPANGGAEARISPPVRPATWADWVVAERGIYFIEEFFGEGRPMFSWFDSSTHQIQKKVLFTSGRGMPFYLTVSSDGRWAAFPQTNEQRDTIMVTDNFH